MTKSIDEDEVVSVVTVNVHEAKTQLSRLLQRVAAGEEIIIAKAGKPIARLIPVLPRPEKRTPGAWKGLVTIEEGFDDPLPDAVIDGFEGRT